MAVPVDRRLQLGDRWIRGKPSVDGRPAIDEIEVSFETADNATPLHRITRRQTGGENVGIDEVKFAGRGERRFAATGEISRLHADIRPGPARECRYGRLRLWRRSRWQPEIGRRTLCRAEPKRPSAPPRSRFSYRRPQMTCGAACASHRDYGRETLFLRGLGFFRNRTVGPEPDHRAGLRPVPRFCSCAFAARRARLRSDDRPRSYTCRRYECAAGRRAVRRRLRVEIGDRELDARPPLNA